MDTIADRRDVYEETAHREATRQEILELSGVLAPFGVSFSDVAENCPRQERTLQPCGKAIRYAGETKQLLEDLLAGYDYSRKAMDTVMDELVNLDSYLGNTGHNYFLYEENGMLQVLPWDYNLAFATYSLGMPDPINDATLYVNYPINTPASGEIMKKRPLYHNLMKNRSIYDRYHGYFDTFLRDYFESGYFDGFLARTAEMIAPYVQKDPTAFCSYDDHLLGVQTLRDFCLLRAESARGQLDGTIPSTIAAQREDQSRFVDASSVWLPDLGEIADLKD